MKAKLDGLSVMVGIPAGRDLPVQTVKSLLGTFNLLQRINLPCQLGMIAGSSVVQWARDEVVDLFLKSDANRLFWIDSDMAWEPEQFMRMVALSTEYEVVCATYPAKIEQPTFYVHRDQKVKLEANEHGLLDIWGVGLGFTVMQRKVLEELAGKAGKVYDEIADREIAEVFRVGAVDENGRRCRRGEDMALFHDIRQLGYKVWLDPEVDLGHIGQKVYRGSIRDALK
jgi:hypothetical protein